jgi:toxin HigB-1
VAIQSFKDKDTENLWNDKFVKAFSSFQFTAIRKLGMIESATSPEDLKVPPGNRLEKLQGNRKGQYSIRINDQYRICFKWEENGAEEVEVTDYHK